MSDAFNGNVVLVWCADGKQKYRIISSNDELDTELARIKNTIPIRLVWGAIINWDNHTVEAFMGTEPDALDGLKQ